MAEGIDLSPIAAADEMLAQLIALQPADANLTPQALRGLEMLHSVARDLGDCPLGDQLADGLWAMEAVLEVWGAERAADKPDLVCANCGDDDFMERQELP